MTRANLDRLGMESSWRYLEVGAGNGSVALEMLHRSNSRSEVVAVDPNTRFFHLASPDQLALDSSLRGSR